MGGFQQSRTRGADSGDLNLARHLLGRSFFLRGTPAPGRGYGARFTVPTINLAPYPELLPANGVYVTCSRSEVANGSPSPTSATVPPSAPIRLPSKRHILDFEPLPLDESTPLKLTFLHRCAQSARWPDPAALKAQIAKDVAHARRWFALACPR